MPTRRRRRPAGRLGCERGLPVLPEQSFQQHHQPLAYFARYAPGTPGRAQHLKDEQDFLYQARTGTLPKVSFIKPLGIENEHPGYASEPNGSDHLVKLLKAIRKGPEGKKTLVVVTYDEFGGQWDHVRLPARAVRTARPVRPRHPHPGADRVAPA